MAFYIRRLTARVRLAGLAGGLLLFTLLSHAAENPADSASDPAQGQASANAGSESQSMQPTKDNDTLMAGPERARLLQLSRDLDPQEVLWLNGRREDPASVMALYLPANRADAEGAMLLLHDRGQHPDWPDAVGSLRRTMPDVGWHTLSLALTFATPRGVPERVLLTRSEEDFPYPQQPQPEPAGAASTTSSGPQSDVAATPGNELSPEELAATNQATEVLEEGQDPVDINAQGADAGGGTAAASESISNTQRINLGLQQLEGFGLQNRVVLGVGAGAEDLVRFLIAYPGYAQNLQGFIWINAAFDQSLLIELKEAAPGFLEQKVLDLVDSTREELAPAKDSRLAFARRNGMADYRQDSVAGSTSLIRDGSTLLKNRIYSWLKRQAPGMRYSGQGSGSSN